MQYYSYVLNKNYIENHKPLAFYGLQEEIPELFVSDLHNTKNLVLNYLDKLKAKK
jgi:adenine-specific DNA-methyltransferase